MDEDAAFRAQAAGIEVVMNRCTYRDYTRLFGVCAVVLAWRVSWAMFIYLDMTRRLDRPGYRA